MADVVKIGFFKSLWLCYWESQTRIKVYNLLCTFLGIFPKHEFGPPPQVEPPHEYMVLSKVGEPVAPRAQSECHVHFAHTFSIGTPHVTGPRGCFEGLV